LGKEIGVFVERLEEQMRLLFNIPFAAKFGGATGNYNAHHVAYPQIDWRNWREICGRYFGLHHSFPTTQIEHYDHFAAFF
jgi:adenylosuccinate lyase